MATTQHRQTWRARLADAFVAREGSVHNRRLAWRLAGPVICLAAGLLFVTSAVSAGGTDLRAGNFTGLDGLANSEGQQVEALRAQAAELTRQVNRLTARLNQGGSATQAQHQLAGLRGPSGLDAVGGPGVTVTLNDAPADVQHSETGIDVSQLLVHQQDIQAVANALWAGGAEAMTIQGQRVVSTTGIKCVGNTVVLHAVPYSPPYVIAAIGPTDQMLASVNASPYIAIYRQVADRYQLGWNVKIGGALAMPAYDGSTVLNYARAGGPKTGGITGNTH
ncbi:MAG: DUF881 domain-containing protein [Nocardioidaceae bacterium]